MVCYYWLKSIAYSEFSSFYLLPFSVPGYHARYHITFNHLICFSYSWLWQFLRLSFFFYDLDNSIHKTRLLVRYTVKRPYDIYLIFGNFHDYTGVDQERQAAMAQEQLRGANPRPRSGQWPREATLRLRSGVAAERSNPTSKEQWLCRCRRAERSYFTFKVRRGDSSKARSSGCALLEQPWRDTPCPR